MGHVVTYGISIAILLRRQIMVSTVHSDFFRITKKALDLIFSNYRRVVV
jgi:hypothetical protein